MDSDSTIVLFEPASRRECSPPSRDAGLREYGFKVSVCRDMHRLPEYAGRLSNVCFVLGGSLAQNCAAASHIRRHAHGSGIIALVSTVAESSLISVLRSGADNYCLASASPGLIATMVSGMRRHGHAGGGSAHRQWVLSDREWELIGPSGGRIPLTTGERAFLSTMFGAPGMRASHMELVSALADAYGEPVSDQARSRLGILVTRLRRKCRDYNEPLPLKSVHGWGYMFAGLASA